MCTNGNNSPRATFFNQNQSMAKSQETFSKKEKEKKRQKKKQDKRERREQRKMEKEQRGTLSFEDQLSYVDENGNIVDTPPDPAKKKIFKLEDIRLGAAPIDHTPMETIRKGEVKFFNNEKGYGFINDLETKESVFVHINNIAEPISEGNLVIFEVEMGPKGANAINVKMAPKVVPKKPKPAVDPKAEGSKEEGAKAEGAKEDVKGAGAK